MLNLALAPVWCGLHINDGGISAERNLQPTSTKHSGRGRNERHGGILCVHMDNSSWCGVGVIHMTCGERSKRGFLDRFHVELLTTHLKKNKPKKRWVEVWGVSRHFPTGPTDSKCCFHQQHLLLAAALKLQEMLWGCIPIYSDVVWSRAVHSFMPSAKDIS